MTAPLDLLAAPLDMTRVKKNPKGFDHIEGHDAIRVANEIFGFDGWSHEIREMQSLGAVPVKSDSGADGYYCAFRGVVRVHALGVFHDGEGFGDSTGYQGVKSQLAGAEGASKEAETDALKRALVKFGDQFGLALYDKFKDSAGHIVGANGGRVSQPAGGGPVPPPAASNGGDPVCNFGKKHPGKTLSQILASDPGYIVWALEKFEPRTPDQHAFMDAAQALKGQPVHSPADPQDSDIPFDRTSF